MYRIRHAGDEITLASMDELAAAIAAGRVTAEAEIFHQRAERWLAIASHPHFKLAAERAQALARPAPTRAPAADAGAEGAEGGAPPLRLVRNDDGGAGPRVTARWKEPPRLVKQPVALRAPSSAVPVPRSEHEPKPAPPEAAAAEQAESRVETPRPKSHVERATDGLPLLDVGSLPPLPPRQATPRPRGAPLFDKAKLGVPTPMPQRAPTPKPAAAPRAPTPAPAPRPEATRVPTPAPVPAPEPVVAAPRVPTPMPTRAPTPMPAALPPARPMMASPEESLDVPPPVRDFSSPYAPPAPRPEPVPAEAPRESTPASVAPWAPEPTSAPSVAVAEPVVTAIEEPGIELVVDASVSDEVITLPTLEEPGRARWPMLVGALVVLAGVGFVAMRPRTTVEPLGPRPVAAQPAPVRPAATPPVAVQPASAPALDEASTGRAPAYVVELPDAPPASAVPARVEEPVVPAAPKLNGVAPVGAIAPDLGVDAVAEQRQRSLEATRRQIDAQLRAEP